MSAPTMALSGVRKGWLLVLVVIVGGALLGVGARTVVATGQGADFDNVFNEPARTADGATEIAWFEGEPLLRSLEPQTIEGIDFAWTRALSSIEDAAAGRGTDGLDVWFSGPAQDQVHELIETGAVVESGPWTSHDITPYLYSIDGQVLAVEIQRTGDSTEGRPASDDQVRVVFILRDGNWRIEHLVRVGSAS